MEWLNLFNPGLKNRRDSWTSLLQENPGGVQLRLEKNREFIHLVLGKVENHNYSTLSLWTVSSSKTNSDSFIFKLAKMNLKILSLVFVSHEVNT